MSLLAAEPLPRGEAIFQLAAPAGSRHTPQRRSETVSDLRLQAGGLLALLPVFHLPQRFTDNLTGTIVTTTGDLFVHVAVEMFGETDFHNVQPKARRRKCQTRRPAGGRKPPLGVLSFVHRRGARASSKAARKLRAIRSGER